MSKTWTLKFYIDLDAGYVAVGQPNLVGPTSYHIQTGSINSWEQSLERIHDVDGSDLTSAELRISRNIEVVSVPDQRFQGAERILSLKSKVSNEQQFDNVKY